MFFKNKPQKKTEYNENYVYYTDKNGSYRFETVNKTMQLVSYENDNFASIEHEYILTNVYDLEQRKNVVRLYNYLKNTQKNIFSYRERLTLSKKCR